MTPSMLITPTPLISSGTNSAAPILCPQLTPNGTPNGTLPKETVRHILLGSASAVRQTIHLLHVLHYSETVLWSPVLSVEEQLIITPAQGETMSLLRKQL